MKHLIKNENIKTLSYEDYLILEGRKEDLENKFKKDLGVGLGEVIFDIDNTDNKAYSEWLLKFFKNNKNELGIDDTLNLKRSEMDKKKWQKNVDNIERLSMMVQKYDNNKKDFSTSINKIKTIDDFRKLLDEKDGFDVVEDFSEDEVNIFHNGLEWLVFQPFTYEISQLANRKNRKSNWCTTYDDGHFQNYLGEKGGLLYCTNKLDSSKDIAFQLRPNETLFVWDYKDSNTDELSSIYDMKEEFDDDSEIYEIIDEVEHKINYPKIDRKALKQQAIDWYDGFGSFEDIGLDVDLYLKLLDETDFISNFVDGEIDNFAQEFNEFLSSYDDQLYYTFEFIWKNVDPHGFTDYFDIEKGIGSVYFWKDEGYPDVDDFIEQLEKPERLKKLELDEDASYDEREVFDMIEEYLESKNKKYGLVESNMKNERYVDYDAETMLGDFYGDPHKMDIDELANYGRSYVSYDDYVNVLVDNMTEDEMFDLIYN